MAGKKKNRALLASFLLINTSERDRDKAIPRILLALGSPRRGDVNVPLPRPSLHWLLPMGGGAAFFFLNLSSF